MSRDDAPPAVIERCPRCGSDLPAGPISACPYCGTPLARPAPAGGIVLPPALARQIYGYEYKSRLTLLGLPLLHVAQGIDPQTGRQRVARGIIAIGGVAIGVVALGGVAVGGLAIGGIALGALALGGMAAGGVALGGMALALGLALGGMAISAQYAVGGLALAPHALGGNAQDPAILRWLERWLGSVAQ